MERIIDRGRGPEIAGTRITVYDILDYHSKGWHHTLIAATLRISSDEVLAAIDYIETHKDEVMAEYQKMLDRCARGNPPELQAKLDAISAEAKMHREARRRQKLEQGANHDSAKQNERDDSNAGKDYRGYSRERIINRGRGPEIAGTRITVYDILDYHGKGWHHTLIAATLRISSDEVLAAIGYIETHKEEVMAEYQKMLDRCARGNPPEIQAKLDALHEEAQILLEVRRRQKLQQGTNHEGNSGGRECSGASGTVAANLAE